MDLNNYAVSINKWMDKEKVICVHIYMYIKKRWDIYIYIYITEYYSAIEKEWNNAIFSNLDGPRDYYGLPQWLSCKESTRSAGTAGNSSSIPGSGDPLEEGMAAHSSVLAWKIPWTEEPDRLQSIGWQTQTWLKQLSMSMRDYGKVK